ncbi:MAG: hypothetical protein JXP34_02635 [Planctomycetes bacterium]|nr:hypothetical protein [Planctomycetota bacterium]
MSRISLEELFLRTIDVLEKTGVRYLIYGGVALPAWGDVVTTQDLDLVVQVDEEEAARLIGAFREAGFLLPDGAESLFPIDTWTCASRGGRDVDIAWGATEFDDEAIRRAVRIRLYGRTVPIASAEDLILYKLVAHRRKDLAHVEDILRRQGARLDLAHLRRWAQWIAEATGKYEVPSTLESMLREQGL